jgi:hypothetical protein
MRMLVLIRMLQIRQLKPPDVVAQFGPQEQPLVGQIGQIPKNCRLVETRRNQLFGQISMSHRSLRLAKCLHNGNASRRCPQLATAQQLTDFLDFLK